MTVVNVEKDAERLTLVLTAEFDAPVQRVWQLWEDPRQLERWWGPPSYPATFVEHDLTPGGTVTYYMTGPEGDTPRGWWRVVTVEPPHRLEFLDGFADDEGNPVADMPTISMRVRIEAIDSDRTRMVVEDRFETLEAMEQLVAMGMEEGMMLALGQIDDLLASDTRPVVGG